VVTHFIYPFFLWIVVYWGNDFLEKIKKFFGYIANLSFVFLFLYYGILKKK